ncbi:MAG: CRTAC1 family protein, partial [Gemmatimonadetes bacterium]|nr:CRTAC1 family protein [Gemmatimonadota bacterium]
PTGLGVLGAQVWHQDVGGVAGVCEDYDRFGSALAVGDFDGDGDEDLVWAIGGEGRLLRVDFGRFVDAAEELGTLAVGDVATAIWADVDDDRRLDAWLTGVSTHLFHNDPDGAFTEVALPPVDPGAGSTNDALFADLDQDGDLDAFEARTGLNRLYRNNGDRTFEEMGEAFGVAGDAEARTWDAAFADLDDDRDNDLVLADGAGGLRLLSNERAGTFIDETERLGPGADFDARAVALADVDGDARIDILAAGPDGVRLLRSGEDGFELERLTPDPFAANPLAPVALEVIDFDNDGHADIAVVGRAPGVGAAARDDAGGLRLLRNDGAGGFEDAARHLPPTPATIQALASFDYNEDGDIDLVLLDGEGRPRLLRNDGGNANHYLQLELVGLGEGSRKNNRFGIGARVEVRAGDLYQVHTVTDPTLLIGLDGRLKADVIRVWWPNGVPQDLYFPGTDQDLVEQQTLKGSCPLLYVWNGATFEFVGDIMWKSALGMPLGILGGTGQRQYAPAFPSQEYRRLPDGVLKPRDGEYVMQVTEELWETIYVDGVELVAVDHPDSIDVYVNERFVPPAPTDLELWRVGERHAPETAVDGRGNDQRAKLAARDFDYVASFRPGRFQGIAEPHELILDLGEAAASGDVTLFLTGWIFPTDASINVAMAQSGQTASRFPALDVIGPDGSWQTAIADLGFPSGKDKTVVADLRGLFPTDDRRVRIRTNLMVYWDEAFFTTGPAEPAAGETRVTVAHASHADLHYRGFSREYRRGQHGPHWFDYEDVTTAPKWHDLAGSYTAFGDVTELVHEGDDRYVIANAGDEITIRFDAASFSPLRDGWRRTFLIYSDGWVKDGDLNIASGDRATPLPHRGQGRYPSQREAYDADPTRWRAQASFQVRRVVPGAEPSPR